MSTPTAPRIVVSDAFPTRQYARKERGGYSLHANPAVATRMSRADASKAVTVLAMHGIAAVAVRA